MPLRQLRSPDRPAVEAILRSDRTFHDDEVAVALELVDLSLASPEGDYRVRVAEEGGEVLGYICFGPTPMTTHTWDLYWAATHEKARGRGIARSLIEVMEAEIARAGGKIIRLETSQMEAYGAARSFYERQRYAEVGRIPDFYRDGDDLIIFAKRL